MVDIASLAIQIDTSDVARAESDLERLGARGAKAEQAAKGVGDAYQNASGKVGAVAGAAAQAGTALERNSAAARENARELASVDRSASSLSGTINKLGVTLAGMTAGMSIKGIIDISDNYGQMADRIKMATASTEEYRLVQERLLQSANRTYRPLAEAQELYIRTADAIRSLGYQTGDALDITDSFSYLLVTNAASADKASNAIDAYSKSIQSGRIEVDSWQSLLAAMPSVVETLSQSLGKSAEEIRQLGITGKLSLTDLNEGLRQTVEANQKLADGMGTTLNDAIVRASNNLSTYLGESSKVTASSRLLSGALDGVTENIDLIATTLGGVAVAAVARYAAVTAKSTAASVAQTVAAGRQAAEELKLAQAQVAATTAAAALARANVGLTASTGQVTTALAAQEAAQQRLAAAQSASVGLGRTVLGLAGGWAGLAVTAGAVALSFVDWGDGAEEAARKSIALREETNLLTRAVEDLDAAQAKQVLQRMEEPYQAAKDEARNYAAQIEYLNAQLDRHPGSAKVDEWNRALVDAKGNLSTVNQELAAQEAKMRDLNARIEQNNKAWKESREIASETDKEGKGFLESLQRRADLSGKLSEVQKTQIAIEKGYAGVLSETAKQEALAAAAVIDRANAALNAGKGIAKATNEQATAYKALMDGLFPAEAAQRKYNEQIGLLKQYLNGDELAKAIDRLNHSMAGADATGPGDAIEDYRKELERLKDDLDPVGVATRKYAKDQDKLNEMLSRGMVSADEHGEMMAELGKRYKENTKETNQWAEWTESSLERVDGAFADAWRNIGDGFKGFRDSLTNAFRQMLAELAHMAITRPIVMQIGAALGLGGGGSGGILSSLGGGGGGGFNAGQLLQYAQTGYSLMTGVGPAVMAGWQTGGLSGALSGGAGYYGNLLGSAASTVGGWLGYGGAASSAAAAQAAGAAAGNSLGVNAGMYASGGGAATSASLSSLASSFAQIAGPLAGLYVAFKGYGAISNGYDFKPKDFDDDLYGVRLGAKVINAYENGITKVFGDSSFLSKALRIPVATIGGIMSSVFGGGWQTKDVGLALSATGGELVGQSYEYQKKKGGLLGSNKKRTRFSALDGETLASLQETFDATEAGVADLFAELSLSVEEGTLDGLQIARKQISTKGKTDEEIQKAISEWFGTAADAMTAELNRVFATGLDLDLAGMQAFVGNLKGVNEVIRYLNVGMYDASVAGGKLAEDLSAVAGGLEALATSSQTYYSAFFSETERAADTLDSVRRTFADAEIPLANSRAAFRAMVEDIDITTEAGRQMFATMMGLAGQAATYYSIVEQQLLGAASNAFAAVQRSVAAQQKQIQQAYSARVGSLNDMAATASASVSALAGVSNSLEAAIKRLRGTSDDAVRMLRAQATATLQNALTASRAGQSLAGFSGLQDALDVASEMDTALYGSLEEFQREQGRTANLIAELEKVNGKQLSTEQRLLESVQNQLGLAQQKYEADMAGLDAQLSYAQAQLDALNGIDNSVMGVTAAVAAMNAAVVAALGGLPKGAAQANTPQNNRSIIDTIYQSVLGRSTKGDEQGAAFWANALQTGTASYQDIAASIAKGAVGNAAESAASKASAAEFLKKSGMPGFASGGVFGGGLRLVGERGPELEVTGPSRIYSASQTAAMLSGGNETASEVRALRSEVAGLRGALHSIAKHTEKTAHGVEQIKDIGIPQEEVA
jgi:tape measure domain-containing protein